MPNMTPALEDVPRAQNSRKKPQLAVRKVRRTSIRKLRSALELVLRQDLREARRGETVGYTPFLFTVARTAVEKTYVTKLITRCDEALNATV